MPISSNTKSSQQARKLAFNVRGKSATVHSDPDQEDNRFFTIAPALPILPGAPLPSKLTKRSFTSSSVPGSNLKLEDAEVGGCDVVALQQAGEAGRTAVVAKRTSAEREKNPDRLCLDRRGLTSFPEIMSEPKLRLVSLQHNLISIIEGNNFTQLKKLVFLDLYDNQIEKMRELGTLENLRVLLLGKNRIKKMEGLESLLKLEVLDLHGNQIVQISGLKELESLKVLNLAGNNVKIVGCNDFQGLTALRELNLKRNKIKKLLGFGETPELQKLYLSNNDIKKIEDMASLAKALQIKQVSIDGNPVTLNPECVSFLVSYLPNLQILSTMQVNEQVRRAAMAWRTTKEQSNSAFLDLSTQVCVNVRREEVITNAKTNWQLFTSESNKCLAGDEAGTKLKNNKTVRNFHLYNSSKLESVKLKTGLSETRTKANFAKFTAINEKIEASKIQFKKRSNSSDSLFLNRLDKANRVNAFNFKLPPILLPIINNLTNPKLDYYINNDNINNNNSYKDNLGRNNKELIFLDSAETTTDSSDLESTSESHESLKTGLRNYLLNNNANAINNHRSTPLLSHSIDTENNNNNNNLLLNFCNSMVAGPTATFSLLSGKRLVTTVDDDPAFQRIDSKSSSLLSSSLPDQTTTKNSISNWNINYSEMKKNVGISDSSNKSNAPSDSGSSSSAGTISSNSKPDDYKLNEDPEERDDDNKSRVQSAQVQKVLHYKSNRAATARAKYRANLATNSTSPLVLSPPPAAPPPPSSPLSSLSNSNSMKEREQGGDYLIEMVGRCLNIYGQGALRFIDRPWEPSKSTDVNIVKFNYVQFNGIAIILSKVKYRFPNAEHFIFKETNISHLGQINALAEVQGLTSIQIEPEGNPIISKDWRTYTIFRLAHWGLKVINGRQIIETEIEMANEEYRGLTDVVMWSLPESLLQPLLLRLRLERALKLNGGEEITAKEFLFRSEPALRNVVAKEALQLRRGNVTQEDLICRHKGKVHLSNMIDRTIDVVLKLQTLEREWPKILHEIIRHTLLDYTDMNSYMKRCSQMLSVD